MFLHKEIEYFPILVDGSPQIVTFSLNRHNQFIKMPRITQPPSAMPNPFGKGLAKLQTPLPHPLIAHAYPTLGEDLLNLTEAETENDDRAIRRM